MRKKPGNQRPYIPPINKIEVSESNLKARWIVLAMLVVVAVVSLSVGFYYALTVEPGWQEITAVTTEGTYGEDFVFVYECGTAETSATKEYKQITNLYTQLARDAYYIFSAEVQSEKQGVQYLNAHINETVTVDPVLYAALTLLKESGCRDPYMAPVVREYNGVFLATTDEEAVLYDPVKDPERYAYVQEALAYAMDPAMIDLEVYDEGQVILRVSDTYLDYAKRNEIEIFLDFGWMRNAFIADYLAEHLAANGFTNGYLVSYDGFTRNLDERNLSYHVNIFDRFENTVSIPVRFTYETPISIVSLRNYPLSEKDRWNYYTYEDGTVTSVFLEGTTGLPISGTDNLVSYSEELGCAQVLLKTAPVFLSSELEEGKLLALAENGIHSIWAEDLTVRYTQENARLTMLSESGGEDYRLEHDCG